MTDAEVIAALTGPEVLALTLFGEARSERVEGKVAVGCVVRNRVAARRFGGDNYKSVCLAPWQFSCWKREGGPENYEAVLKAARLIHARKPLGSALRECLWVSEGVLQQHAMDITRASTHYMTSALWESKPPKWAIGQTPAIRIGGHVFFNGVK